MSQRKDTDSQTPTVLELAESQWFKRREMADRLGVSTRTLSRLVNRGEVLKRDSDRGMLYRPTRSCLEEYGPLDDSIDADTDGELSGQADRQERPRVRTSGQTDRHVSGQTDRQTDTLSSDDRAELERKAGALEKVEAQLERELERLERSESKAEELTERIIELTGQLERARAELEHTAGAAEERDTLREKSIEQRARLHLERGRRELAEERLDTALDQLDATRAELERLRQKVDQAEEGDSSRGFNLSSLFS